MTPAAPLVGAVTTLPPPSYVEAAGEDAFAAHAAVDAGVHDSPAFEQPGANLIGAAKGKLIDAHHFRDALVRSLPVQEQFERAGKGIGNAEPRRSLGQLIDFIFVDDESAAD